MSHKYKLVESDITNDTTNQTNINDIQQLVITIDTMTQNNPQSLERFSSTAKQKFGVETTKDINKIPMWLKITQLSIIGTAFIGAIQQTIVKALQFVDSMLKRQFFNSAFIFGIVSAFLSFLLYKLLVELSKQPTTESSYHSISYSKFNRILESIYYESDISLTSKLASILNKAKEVCDKMFLWIKEKIRSGIEWVKNHPYLTIVFLIVIGFTLYAVYKFTGNNYVDDVVDSVEDGIGGGTAGDTLGGAASQYLDGDIEYEMALRIIDSDRGAEVLERIADQKPKLYTRLMKIITDLAKDNDEGALHFLSHEFVV